MKATFGSREEEEPCLGTHVNITTRLGAGSSETPATAADTQHQELSILIWNEILSSGTNFDQNKRGATPTGDGGTSTLRPRRAVVPSGRSAIIGGAQRRCWEPRETADPPQ